MTPAVTSVTTAEMADVFISFRTDDTPRVKPIREAFRARGLSVFWSNDIPPGAPNYQAIIKQELFNASVVVVAWTRESVHSGPVTQECSQAERLNKLFQVLLDDIEPIDFPMEVRFKAQKTILLGWTGNIQHPEWLKLNDAIDVRIGRRPAYPAEAIAIQVGTAARSETRWFVPGAGKTEWFTDVDFGPEMVVVPAGSFMMGSPDTESGREIRQKGTESPQHKVTIAQPFAVSRHAVTRGQFAAFVDNFGHQMDGMARWRDPGFAQDDSHPVVCVNWDDAKAYAAWLAQSTCRPYRLLTEAEWEYAARAGTTPPFWWGSSITPAQANYNGSVYAGGGSKGENREATVPVGSFAANAWGLFNVHGNVWEWCEDAWHDTYNGAPTDGTAWLQGGDESGRVVRGGSWYNDPDVLRSAVRSWVPTEARYHIVGLRVGRTLSP
jgi:formylglycine-generating enzyme required for sulfatase activity